MALLDPDLGVFGSANPDPYSGARKSSSNKNEQINMISSSNQKGFFTYVGVFRTYYLHKVYFSFNVWLFVTAKSDQDPDPHESTLIWLPEI